MFKGIDLTSSPRFPEETLCDFTVRRMGRLVPVTVQCALPINIFNSKIFFIVWFLLFAIALINTFNYFMWMYRIIIRYNRYLYIRKHLTTKHKLKVNKNLVAVTNFVDQYLQIDGVFLIRLMSKNSNSIRVSEFVAALFDQYLNTNLSEEESILLDSPKNSIAGISANHGSYTKSHRKGSMPPAYSSALARHFHHNSHYPYGAPHPHGSHPSGRQGDSGVEDLEDHHSRGSRGSSEAAPYPEQATLGNMRDEVSFSRSHGRPHHPTAPPHPNTSVPNNYSVTSTLTNNPHDPNFDPDLHPKAKEAYNH